jgi:dTDP-4-amino-4,6-dideoxygalactose transaminase
MKKIKLSEITISDSEERYVKQVLSSGWLTYGEMSKNVEKIIKKNFNFKYVSLTNSCTSGIHAALIANDVGNNQEVITSPMTFVSTINSLFQLKTKIILADIDLKDFNIDITSVKNLINSKTRCVLPTHYGGIPANINELLKLKKKFNFKIIEDAATAFGSKINNQFIGSLPTDATVFSFYANKIITSAEGGCVVTNNKKVSEKLKKIIFCGINKDTFSRGKGQSWKYKVTIPGYKYNISDVHSAILMGQLEKFKNIMSKRLELIKLYLKYFEEFENEKILLKINRNINNSSNYIFPILLNKKKIKSSRNKIIDKLLDSGISSTVHYIPGNQHIFYKKIFKKFNLKNTNYAYNNIITLPLHNKLEEEDIFYIYKSFKKLI